MISYDTLNVGKGHCNFDKYEYKYLIYFRGLIREIFYGIKYNYNLVWCFKTSIITYGYYNRRSTMADHNGSEV